MKAPAMARLRQKLGDDAGWRTFILSSRQEAFVDTYVESMARTGFTEDSGSIRSRARVFCGLMGDPEDWEAMPLAECLAMRKDMRRVVT